MIILVLKLIRSVFALGYFFCCCPLPFVSVVRVLVAVGVIVVCIVGIVLLCELVACLVHDDDDEGQEGVTKIEMKEKEREAKLSLSVPTFPSPLCDWHVPLLLLPSSSFAT